MGRGEIRKKLIHYAFEDWKRLMQNGLTPKEARIAIETDYELVEAEKILINEWMLSELEVRLEGGNNHAAVQ